MALAGREQAALDHLAGAPLGGGPRLLDDQRVEGAEAGSAALAGPATRTRDLASIAGARPDGGADLGVEDSTAGTDKHGMGEPTKLRMKINTALDSGNEAQADSSRRR